MEDFFEEILEDIKKWLKKQDAKNIAFYVVVGIVALFIISFIPYLSGLLFFVIFLAVLGVVVYFVVKYLQEHW